MTYQERSAIISIDGRYRYFLWRSWGTTNDVEVEGYVCFIMLNPSAADGQVDDPTIRKCVSYAEKWGHCALVVVNLFGFRATDPRELAPLGLEAAEGPNNLANVLAAARRAHKVVCAWGNEGALHEQSKRVIEKLRADGIPFSFLKMNKTGEPAHPLYLSGKLQPTPWT